MCAQPTITAIILTKNEEKHIAACIDSLRWTDTILVYDSFSTDHTVELAQASGARIEQHAFIDYTDQRNSALTDAARVAPADWYLFIDADERTSLELADEIRLATRSDQHVGYWIPRHNYIFGRIARYAAWWPDHQLRLLRAGYARYDTSRAVHETVLLDSTAGNLQTPLIHYNYENAVQFMQKQARYTRLAAEEMIRIGARIKPHHFITAPIRHFLWRYVTHHGYRGGWHGLRLSLLMAYWEWRKLQMTVARQNYSKCEVE